MKYSIPARRAFFLACTAILCTASSAGAQGRTLVAIVNRLRPESGLTRDELVQIYRGEIRYWPSSRQPIQFALPPGSPETRDAFIRKVLHTTPTAFEREWRAKRFRGESALIPNPDLSRSEVMQAVQTQRHFIAIVELEWLRSIDARFKEEVKILAIDGKAPEDAGYPLLVSALASWQVRRAYGAHPGGRGGAAIGAAQTMP